MEDCIKTSKKRVYFCLDLENKSVSRYLVSFTCIPSFSLVSLSTTMWSGVILVVRRSVLRSVLLVDYGSTVTTFLSKVSNRR